MRFLTLGFFALSWGCFNAPSIAPLERDLGTDTQTIDVATLDVAQDSRIDLVTADSGDSGAEDTNIPDLPSLPLFSAEAFDNLTIPQGQSVFQSPVLAPERSTIWLSSTHEGPITSHGDWTFRLVENGLGFERMGTSGASIVHAQIVTWSDDFAVTDLDFQSEPVIIDGRSFLLFQSSLDGPGLVSPFHGLDASGQIIGSGGLLMTETSAQLVRSNLMEVDTRFYEFGTRPLAEPCDCDPNTTMLLYSYVDPNAPAFEFSSNWIVCGLEGDSIICERSSSGSNPEVTIQLVKFPAGSIQVTHSAVAFAPDQNEVLLGSLSGFWTTGLQSQTAIGTCSAGSLQNAVDNCTFRFGETAAGEKVMRRNTVGQGSSVRVQQVIAVE